MYHRGQALNLAHNGNRHQGAVDPPTIVFKARDLRIQSASLTSTSVEYDDNFTVVPAVTIGPVSGSYISPGDGADVSTATLQIRPVGDAGIWNESSLVQAFMAT